MCLNMRQRDSTKDHIIETAFDLFSRNAGASLGDLAEAAGIGRATLHRHFAGRDALMLALAQQATAEIDAAVEAATKDAETYTQGLKLALAAMVPLARRQMFLATEPVMRFGEMAQIEARDRAELIDAIDHAKTEGTFDPALPSPWIAEAYDTLIYAAWALVESQEATPRQAAHFAWTTLLKGTRP